MGLTNTSTGSKLTKEDLFTYKEKFKDKILVGFAGNPNVGKSTLFNNLTGMHQHTGNWPGKTVSSAVGHMNISEKKYTLVDLPGTYSLLTHSKEEDVARDFICFSSLDLTVVVCDATCLERNLNLCLQIIEMTENVIVAVNLLDEADRKGIKIDLEKLSYLLNVPVIGVVASKKKSVENFKTMLSKAKKSKEKKLIQYPAVIEECIEIIQKPLEKYNCFSFSKRWLAINLLTNQKEIEEKIFEFFSLDLLGDIEVVSAIKNAERVMKRYGTDKNIFIDKIATTFVKESETIAKSVTLVKKETKRDLKIDKLLTGKITGFPLMIVLLMLIFWITITLANYPSELLSTFFADVEKYLLYFFEKIGFSKIITEIIVRGVYRVLAWVVSVMLPPMAIFFPMFTLLEDLGYLPRVAFNLDNCFQKCNTCGKQALTICMGFGCNAAGVTGSRIIDSERERLTAILTNSFVPCNGRFPMLIAIISIFFVSSNFLSNLMPTFILTAVICIGIIMTFFVSKILTKTCLRGVPSSFSLELPPFRKPQIGKVIVRSIFDRTLFVLGRAACVAAPAGLVIWLMANMQINSESILKICADFLEPFAELLGLDGIILIAFILGFPANEIVIPLTIMGYTSGTEIKELTNLEAIGSILTDNGWNEITALCFIIFTLMHWPCSTTCLTIFKETKSLKWTVLGFLIPTVCGMTVCFIINSIYKILTAI